MAGINWTDDTLTHHTLNFKDELSLAETHLYHLMRYVWNHEDANAASWLENGFLSTDYVEHCLVNLGFSFIHDMKNGDPKLFTVLEAITPASDYIWFGQRKTQQEFVEKNIAQEMQKILSDLFLQTVHRLQVHLSKTEADCKMDDSPMIKVIDTRITWLNNWASQHQKLHVPSRLLLNSSDVHSSVVNCIIQSSLSKCVYKIPPRNHHNRQHFHSVPSNWWSPVKDKIKSI